MIAIVRGLLIALAALSVTAPGAQAWLAPTDLGVASGASVASVLSAGGGVAGWVSGGRLWVGSAAVSGSSVDDFALAGNDAGALAAIWTDSSGTRVLARWRDAGGAWSSISVLAVGGSDWAFAARPAVTVDPGGRATFAWMEDGDGYAVAVATHEPGAAGVDVASVWSQTGYPRSGKLGVASNAAGDVLVAWSAFHTVGTIAVGAALRTGGGPFEPGDLVRYLGGSSVDLVTPLLDASGNAAIVWGQSGLVHVTERPAGGSWPGTSTSTQLSTPGVSAGLPVAAMNASGQAVVAWYESHGPFNEGWVVGAARDAGAWSAAADITAVSPALLVQTWDARILDDGRAAVAFTSASPPSNPGYAWVVERAADGSWAAPVKVSGPSAVGSGPQALALAASAGGDLAAVWRGPTGAGGMRVGSAVADRTPPVIAAASIPAAGVAGVAVPFAVAASDARSGVASVAWDFGDGSTGSGSSASHAFAAPGTYHVVVTVRDAASHAVAAVGDVVVGAAVAPVSVGPPVVTGTAAVGAALACGAGAWGGTAPAFTFAWLRDGAPVGAGASLAVTAADAGHVLACRVTATNAAGSASATSAAVGVPVPPPPVPPVDDDAPDGDDAVCAGGGARRALAGAACDDAPPARLSLRVPARRPANRVAGVLRRGVAVDVAVSRACRLEWRATIPARLARAAGLAAATPVAAGWTTVRKGTGRVTIRLTPRARRALAGRRTLTLSLRLVARAGGERASRTVTVRARR